MPKTRRGKALYSRGGYRLDERPDRENLVITWYDPERKRERIVSAGTRDVGLGKRELDRLYIENTPGQHVCPTCGQPWQGQKEPLVTDVIADYLVAAGDLRASANAIKHRLNHVVRYITTLTRVPRATEIDEQWVENFRRWFAKQPITSKSGAERERTLSTIENSVLQLAAAINWSHGRGDTSKRAKFRPVPPNQVNRTPQYRADLATIARMFAFAAEPRMKNKRLSLLRFLRISFATLARPDAAHEVSTDKKRGQWDSSHRVLNLNPKGRRQTKKYRATVPVIEHVAAELDKVDGPYIAATSVKSAFTTMAKDLGLPEDGESGMKLIRRSVADLLRDRLAPVYWPEVEMFLGHDKFDETSSLYAPFRPDYLRHAKDELAKMADEIQKTVPSAFAFSQAPLRIVA